MSASAPAQSAEASKALVRQMMPDFDKTPVGAATKWMTPDFTTVMNGEPPMNLDLSAARRGRHEVLLEYQT